MSFEAAIVARITGDATVQSLMGTRLYPDIVPQDVAMPAAFYTLVSNPVEYAHDGEVMEHPMMQISIFAEAKDTLVSLRDAIRTRVSGYRGTVGSEAIHGIRWREMVNTFDTETGLYECVAEIRALMKV